MSNLGKHAVEQFCITTFGEFKPLVDALLEEQGATLRMKADNPYQLLYTKIFHLGKLEAKNYTQKILEQTL